MNRSVQNSNSARNAESQRRFAVWQQAQAEADVAARVWGKSSPHNAREAQERARVAMQAWMQSVR